MSTEPIVVAARIRDGYGLPVIRARTVTDPGPHETFQLEITDHPQMRAAVYSLRADLRYEHTLIDLTAALAAAGVPMPQVVADTKGSPVHRGVNQLPLTVWAGLAAPRMGHLTPDAAPIIGATLAHVHRSLDDVAVAGLPIDPEPARSLDQQALADQYRNLLAVIVHWPCREAADEPNRNYIQRRLTHVRVMDALRNDLPSLRLARIHGAYTPRRVHAAGGQVTAVAGLRARHGDRIRELAIAAFDPPTIAQDPQWLDRATGLFDAYLGNGGPVEPADLIGCARLAVLHHLCSLTYMQDRYLRQLPPRHRDRVDRDFADATTLITTVSDALADVEDHLYRRYADKGARSVAVPHVPYDATADRPAWTDLPPELRMLIETQIEQPVLSALTHRSGFTPGFAATLTLSDGSRVFCKAVPAGSGFADVYHREARNAAALPEQIPAPRLRWHADTDEHVVLCFDAVDGRPPALPWTGDDLAAVLDAYTQAAPLLRDPSLRLRAAVGPPGDLPAGWHAVASGDAVLPAAASHLAGHIDILAGWERHLLHRYETATGFCHYDLRPDNCVIDDGGRAWIVDWSSVRPGPVWTDTIMLLVSAVGDHDTDQLFALHPSAADATARDLDATLAWLAGAWLTAAARPAPPRSPHLRDHQLRNGLLAWTWLATRHGISPSARSAPGLAYGTVTVTGPDPAWPTIADRHQARLHQALGPLAQRMEHVGSTAVPGLAAKPIIDLAVQLSTDTAPGLVIDALATSGYLFRGDKGDEGGLLFVAESAPGVRTVHVHVLADGDPQWDRYLAVRGRLRSDPDTAARYQALKRELAARHPQDRAAYTAAKAAFLTDLLSDLPPSPTAAKPAVSRVRTVLITPAGHLLAIRRSKPGHDVHWVLPGGGIEPGDTTLEAAAAREVLEETGGQVDLHRLIHIAYVAGRAHAIFLGRIRAWDEAARTGPEFADPGNGGYHLEELPLDAHLFEQGDIWPTPTAVFPAQLLRDGTDLFTLPDLRDGADITWQARPARPPGLPPVSQPLAFVTGSSAKFGIAAQHLAPFGIAIEQVPFDLPEIQSTSVVDVAVHKARAAYAQLGRALFVEDSGFVLDELGWPGPMIRQFVDAAGAAGVAHLADLTATRACTSTAALVYIDPTGHEHVFTNTRPGTVATAPQGTATDGRLPLWTVYIPPAATLPLAAMPDREREDWQAWWAQHSVFSDLGRHVADIPPDPKQRLRQLRTARAGLLRELADAARADARVGALLLIGSLGRRAGDDWSDLDLIIVPAAGIPAADLDPVGLFTGDRVMASFTKPRNAPTGGTYTGTCIDGGGLPIWVDTYTWPAGTARVPADATVLHDHLGLAASTRTFTQLLTDHRDHSTSPGPDSPEVDTLLRVCVAAKYTARGDTANLRRVLARTPITTTDPANLGPALRGLLDTVTDPDLSRAVAAITTLTHLATAAHAAVPPADRPRQFVQGARAILICGDEIVLVREERDGVTHWAVPGGGVEPGELTTDTVIREIAEEIGVTVRWVGPLAYLVNTTTDTHPSTVVTYYEVTDWDGDPHPLDPDITDIAVVSRTEALRLVTQEPRAPRRVVEPLAAYLRGDTMPGMVWTWRGDDVVAPYQEGGPA